MTLSIRKLAIWSTFCVLHCPLLAAAADTAAWQPEKTWVLAVSSLIWKYDRGANLPKIGRQDLELIEAFKDRGVPASQIVLLRDQHGTLANIQDAFNRLLMKSKRGDWLVFYFNGHGSRDVNNKRSRYYFVNYDARDGDDSSYLYMSLVFDWIERGFHGSHAIIAADCCCSGGIVVEAKNRDGRIKYACLASVTAHNNSTSDWTFTRCLMHALRGDGLADLSGNKQITLGELSDYISREMAFVERQRSSFYLSDGFDPKTQLAAAKPKSHPDIGKHVVVKSEGQWDRAIVIDVQGSRYRVAWIDYEDPEWVEKKDAREFVPKHWDVGERVTAKPEDDDKWRPATILRFYQDLHQVHFDGMSSLHDEWVPSSRIKPLP